MSVAVLVTEMKSVMVKIKDKFYLISQSQDDEKMKQRRNVLLLSTLAIQSIVIVILSVMLGILFSNGLL